MYPRIPQCRTIAHRLGATGSRLATRNRHHHQQQHSPQFNAHNLIPFRAKKTQNPKHYVAMELIACLLATEYTLFNMADTTVAMNLESSKLAPSAASLTPLRWPVAVLLILIAASGYWLAFATRYGAAAILAAMPCIFLLSQLRSARRVFYAGAICGLAMYVPQLWFFLSIFHLAALALWCIAALPIGILTLLLFLSRRRLGTTAAMWLTPVLWMGVEFFRSELYYLKFAWVLPGQVVAFLPGLRMMWFGVYGLGFLCALGAALL